MFSTRWCLWTVTWCVPTTRLYTTDLFSAGQTRAAPSAPVSAGPHRLAQSDWLCHYHLYLWHLYNISQHFLAASYNKFPPEKQQPSLIITSLYSSHSTHSLHCSTSALAAHQHCSGLWGISCHSFIKILPPAPCSRFPWSRWVTCWSWQSEAGSFSLWSCVSGEPRPGSYRYSWASCRNRGEQELENASSSFPMIWSSCHNILILSSLKSFQLSLTTSPCLAPLSALDCNNCGKMLLLLWYSIYMIVDLI